MPRLPLVLAALACLVAPLAPHVPATAVDEPRASDVPPSATCPVISPVPYGTAPGDQRPGTSCRTFVVTAPEQSLFVATAMADDTRSHPRPYTRVHDATGATVCSNSNLYGELPQTECRDLPAGTYVVTARPSHNDPPDETFETSDLLFALYDAADGRGCVPLETGFATVRSSYGQGQLDCWEVQARAGEPLGFARPDDGESWAYSMRDTQGSRAGDCYFDPNATWTCTPPVSGTMRMIGGRTYVLRKGTESITHFTRDDYGTCSVAAPGTTAVTLDGPGSSGTCVVIPGQRFTHRSHVSLDTASDPQRFAVDADRLVDTGASFCQQPLGYFVTSLAVVCRGSYDHTQTFDAAQLSVVLLLVGEGPQTITLQRREEEVDPIRVVNRARPHVLDLSPLPIRRPRHATVGEVLSAGHGNWAGSSDFSYQWFAGTRPIPGAVTTAFTVPAALVGRKLSVRVTAHADPYLYPGVAYTPAVAISARPGRVATPRVRVDGQRATITWTGPDTNGALTTGYTLRLDGRTVTVPGTRRRYAALGLRPGRHLVTVTASNRNGPGPVSARRTFRTSGPTG